MIDKKGYRPNVGIVIANGCGQVFWGKRVNQNAWQFPQGGIQSKESPEEALYRELHEETGLEAGDVRIIAVTKDWLRYRLPQHLKRDQKTHFVGQKQKYFLIRLTSDDDAIKLNQQRKPEFDDWKWVSFWYPLSQIVGFKRPVYQRALRELAPRLAQCMKP
ncbi:MAG: RNA pyrophosphohydrolase [Pseudomonadales bacterium]|jgi:putative (di)nucleoside polyphosphate hydrolase